MDPRLTPATPRVAAEHLRGIVPAPTYSAGEAAVVAVPVTDLCDRPGGSRQRQLLMGESLVIYDREGPWVFVESGRDGYCGWVDASATGADEDATHRVAVPATHLYAQEDFKGPMLLHLSFGAKLRVTAERRKYWETTRGFVPKRHLRALDRPFADAVTAAQMHFGVPYLWGGNSILGIDCSGLVQAALLAAGIACPGDSDLQRAHFGTAIPEEALQRGDLVFWKGHVAMMVDETTMIHANAHHMAVAYEGYRDACRRIEVQGDGAVLARLRPGT